ncbi:uncharacterized protein C21orf58 homolog [Tamandua tetradactyla]|uniref:uncharacterized protein C21orf58 homolog n=1 Tax=Tamandua tetradactyla TaxID=48850 RepID=UPI0040545B0C
MAAADQVTRLALRLLEQKLEQERAAVEWDLSGRHLVAGNADGACEALRGALERRKDLLQRLRVSHGSPLPLGHALAPRPLGADGPFGRAPKGGDFGWRGQRRPAGASSRAVGWGRAPSQRAPRGVKDTGTRLPHPPRPLRGDGPGPLSSAQPPPPALGNGWQLCRRPPSPRPRQPPLVLQELRVADGLPPARAWGGTSSDARGPAPPPEVPPVTVHPGAPPAPLGPESPGVRLHSVLQPPAAILQLLPQQPLITQAPSTQVFPTQRAGSIKEDVVELLLLQNAQMHQILAQSLMLRALPAPCPQPGPQVGAAAPHPGGSPACRGA